MLTILITRLFTIDRRSRLELIRDGVPLNFETLGDTGPWVVLTPGGHSALEDVRDLGQALCQTGCRVLLHDRRNCGRSGLWLDASSSEQEVWVEDVIALMDHLDIDQVIAGGGSAGCRLSLLMAIRYPDRVIGLLLWWVTGGKIAAETLSQNYYGQYSDLAAAGQMDAVAASEFYRERIDARPENRAILMSHSPQSFSDVMNAWKNYFLEGADDPVLGMSASQLQQITVPTCIIPGSDDVHPRAVAIALSELLENADLNYPFARDELPAIKRLPLEDILARFRENTAEIFSAFTRQHFIDTQ